jgi:hypothetical protein
MSATALVGNPQHPMLLGECGHNALVNFKFVLRAPWTACRLCGAVYQTELDRKALFMMLDNDPMYQAVYEEGKQIRHEWQRKHDRAYHSDREIRLLNLSGLSVTPEAAINLAPYGIVPIGDAGNVYIDEIDEALFEAPRAPVNDSDG